MDHVAGYVLALDMTARHIQEKLKKMQHPWLLCKGKKNKFSHNQIFTKYFSGTI